VVSIKWEPQVGWIHRSGQRLNLAKNGCSTMAENGPSWESWNLGGGLLSPI